MPPPHAQSTATHGCHTAKHTHLQRDIPEDQPPSLPAYSAPPTPTPTSTPTPHTLKNKMVIEADTAEAGQFSGERWKEFKVGSKEKTFHFLTPMMKNKKSDGYSNYWAEGATGPGGGGLLGR